VGDWGVRVCAGGAERGALRTNAEVRSQIAEVGPGNPTLAAKNAARMGHPLERTQGYRRHDEQGAFLGVGVLRLRMDFTS
jgi:hypothetical protein